MSSWLSETKVDLRTKQARAAQEFMQKKGYPDIRPFGIVQIDQDLCWYFYYRLPEGILELEVYQAQDRPGDGSVTTRFNRRVSAFITDPERVRDLLNL